MLINVKLMLIRVKKKEWQFTLDKFFNKEKKFKEEILRENRENYADWKSYNMEMNKPFFSIHTDFESLFLKDISGGALKLYIYLGFKAKFKTGELWQSIPSIANYFEKDTRTIANWFEELEKFGLVKRYQTGFKRAANTFLQPYGFEIYIVPLLGKANTRTFNNFLNNESEEEKNFNEKVIFFNYSFEEYSLILLKENPTNSLKKVIVFEEFEQKDIPQLKKELRHKNISTDNFDIEISILKSVNKEYAIYKNLLDYYNLEIL